MEENSNSKVIAAIAEEIAAIKGNISEINQKLSKGNIQSEANAEKEDAEFGQTLVDLNQKLDKVIANQKEPNILLAAFSIGGVLLACLVFIERIVHKFI